MKNLLPFLAGVFATLLVGCATDPGVVHTTEFYDVVLSPAKRTDTKEDITLVSIGRRGRVTIRDSRGTLWTARQGEQFKNAKGGYMEYTLQSVELNTGRVVIQGTMRLYY